MMTFKFNPAAKPKVKGSILSATQEIFELDIKPEAVRTSPVTEAGVVHNLDMLGHEPRTATQSVRVYGTGFNRQSIDVEVEQTARGVEATLFTQSGYGGYLEVGTSKMRPQPYLWPAFEKFLSTLRSRIRSKIHG